jgi:hypothetical protein
MGLPADSSFSWGLNRAIFYESADKARAEAVVREAGQQQPQQHLVAAHESYCESAITPTDTTIMAEVYCLGEETVFEDQSLGKAWEPRFTIDGKIQTLNDFDKEVRSHFGIAFDMVWAEALDLVGSLPKETLSSKSAFFECVYLARRDELVTRWASISGRAAALRAVAVGSAAAGQRDV